MRYPLTSRAYRTGQRFKPERGGLLVEQASIRFFFCFSARLGTHRKN